MKHQTAVTLSMAAVSFSLLVPGIAAERNLGSLQDTQNNSATSDAGKNEAGLMVGARGALDRTLDAKEAQAGQVFQVTLANTVHLKNGPELPSGTILLGKVVTDDMETKGISKLALCINQAKLKDGKIIEIKVTIMGVNPPGSGTPEEYSRPAGDRLAHCSPTRRLTVSSNACWSNSSLTM